MFAGGWYRNKIFCRNVYPLVWFQDPSVFYVPIYKFNTMNAFLRRYPYPSGVPDGISRKRDVEDLWPLLFLSKSAIKLGVKYFHYSGTLMMQEHSLCGIKHSILN